MARIEKIPGQGRMGRSLTCPGCAACSPAASRYHDETSRRKLPQSILFSAGLLVIDSTGAVLLNDSELPAC
jgi:hypothetical protein